MAGVRDDDLVMLGGFRAGVNNVAPEHDLPRDEDGNPLALRAAVNMDLVGPSKKPRLRAGYTRVQTGRFHSPGKLSGALVAVQDGDLVAFDRHTAPLGTLRAGVGHTRVSYADVHGDLYWTNGQDFRRIRGDDLSDTPGWIDCPGTPLLDAVADGGFSAGTYRVAMTWFDDDGRESGAAGVAELVLAEGEGIRVHGIPAAPEGASWSRIYVSPPNGEELYAAVDLQPGVSQYVVGVGSWQAGRALETLWHQPLPPGQILRHWNGRLLVASNNLLLWSAALRVGLTTRDHYMRFGERITLLEPIGAGGEGAGCWIADHARTYWMAGSAPESWRRVIRYDYPAVFGTSVIVKGVDLGLDTTEPVACWLATNGVFCAGLPGGSVVPLTEGRLALPAGEEGAALFRAHNGLRQIVTSFIASGGNGLAIGDQASATVTPHPG